jgi:hypothetical protein
MNIPGARSPTLAASLLLPGAVGNLFRDDGLTHADDLVGQPPMQAFAVGSQFALAGGFSAPGGQIPFAVFPLETLLATLLDLSFGIVVVRVVGAALSLQLPLEPPDRRCLGGQFRRDAPLDAPPLRGGR